MVVNITAAILTNAYFSKPSSTRETEREIKTREVMDVYDRFCEELETRRSVGKETMQRIKEAFRFRNALK